VSVEADRATEAYHSLVERVLDAELVRPEGGTLDKATMLSALVARRELVHRLVRWRWIAIEDARAAGASWAEIDAALGMAPGRSRLEYERRLAAQIRHGLCSPDRRDPGPPGA
jgi:hypothetical protein